MAQLFIDNSISKLTQLTTTQMSDLREALTYRENPNKRYFNGGYVKKRCLLDRAGSFPTGLLYRVLNYFKSNPGLTVIDSRQAPGPHNSSFKASLPFTLYDSQKAAIQAARYHSRGIICAPTGSGKSAIVAGIIQALKVPTMVIVPTLELKRQLTEFLGQVFPKECQTSMLQIVNVDSIPMRPIDSSIGCIIIDEFHHSGAKTYRKLNEKAWKHVYYRIGLTATPFRSDDCEQILLETILSRVIYDMPYQECVENKQIVPIEAYYVDIPRTTITAKTWASVYKELVVSNYKRNLIISNLLSHINNNSVLCLVKEIQHGTEIRSICESFSLDVPFVYGQSNEKKLITDFSKGTVKQLIGTTGVVGEGIDTKSCEYVIIAGLGKSKNAFMQQVGRCFRTFPGKTSGKIIIFRDPSHKFTLDHFRHQVKYLKEEYGIIPVKLEL